MDLVTEMKLCNFAKTIIHDNMNKKEQNITGNGRARYTSPRMKVVKIHARSHILSVSTESSVKSNDWASGSKSSVGFGDDEDE